MATVTTAPHVSAAVRATYASFIGLGFGFANWAARIPQVRDHLHLSPADLGLVLLSIATGSLIALPLSGTIVHRINSRRTVTAMAVLLSLGLATVGAGYLVGLPLVVVGLFLFGFASGAWDVAMNVQAAIVERQLGRAIMPRFHAGYSIGTVAGALLGAVMVALAVPVTVHLVLVAALTVGVIPLAVRAFVPDTDEATAPAADTPEISHTANALARWREPRTLLVGVIVLSFAFSEGAGNDWISVALIDSYHAPAFLGTLGFAAFLAAMTAARWFGTSLLDRYGRVTVLRGLGAVAIAGLIIFVFSPFTALAFVGALLWGAGASLGFPVGMSAAADDPAHAAGRVSVVASIGYCAFLGGPPLVGFLGDHITVLRALLAVAVMLALASLLTSAMKPLPHADPATAGRQPDLG